MKSPKPGQTKSKAEEKLLAAIREAVKVLCAKLNQIAADDWLPVAVVIAKEVKSDGLLAGRKSWLFNAIGPLSLNPEVEAAVIQFMRLKVQEWDEKQLETKPESGLS
jgi:hypothetical protein